MVDPEVILNELLANDASVRSLARQLVTDHADAEDVAQDAWVAALRNPPRRMGAIPSWFSKVVRRIARKQRHAEDRHQEKAAATATLDFAEARRIEAARHEVATAVFGLEEPYRTAIYLRYFEDLPPRKIAERLGVSVSAVEGRLYRGLQKLRARLDRDFGDRRTWCKALLPFTVLTTAATTSAAGTTAATAGALIMGTKIKVAVAVIIAVGVAYTFWPPADDVEPARKPNAEIAKPDAPESTKATPAGVSAGGDPEAMANVAEVQPEAVTRLTSLEPTGRAIVGLVTDQDGAPIVGATLRAFRFVPGAVELKRLVATRTDEAGRYRLTPVQVRCVLEAAASGHYIERRFVSPATRQDFQLGEPGTLRGAIVFAGTEEPCGDVTVALYSDDPLDALSRISWYAHNRSPITSVRSMPDGTYRIAGLRPGGYRVRILADAVPQSHLRGESVPIAAGRETVRDFVVGRGFTLTGRVTDSDTHAPVVNAEVTLTNNERKRGITDTDGRYTIQGLEWDLIVGAFGEVNAKGYRDTSFVFHNNNFANEFTRDFALQRGAEVAGRVLDPDGEPVARARVGFLRAVILERNKWNRSMSAAAHVTTDANGVFSMTTPATTRGLQLFAAKDGFAWGSTERILLNRGQKKEGVVIRLERGGTIRGRVQDQTGTPVEAARVNVRTDRGTVQSIDTRADGRYELEAIHAGVYGMDVYPPGLAERGCSPFMTTKRSGVAVSDGQVTEIDWVLRPGAVIAGRVVDENGQAVIGAAVRAVPPNMRGRIFPDRPMRTVVTGADGRFRIEGFEEFGREHSVQARKMGYEPAWGKTAKTGQTDLLLTVKSLRKLEGRVVDGATRRPVQEFRIHGSYEYAPGKRGPMYPRRHGSAMSFADPEGRFSMLLPPGKYEIEALTPDGMRSDARKLEMVAAGRTQSVVLTVSRAGSLSGEVLDPKGKPVHRAVVGLWDLRTERVKALRWLRTDASGRFEARALPAGSFVLEGFSSRNVRRPEVLQSFKKVSISTGQNREISLTLAPGAEVGVTVVGSGNRPVPGARVTIQRPDGIPNVLKMSRSLRMARAMGAGFRSGKPLSSDQVRELNKAVSRRLAVTDQYGRLATLQLPPGSYTVHVTADGFKPVKKVIRVAGGRKNEITITIPR